MADIPSFSGIHNHRKVIVLACLLVYDQQSKRRGLTLREISEFSNTSYDYVRIRMPKFARWRYVVKRAELRNSRAMPVYKLADKGRDYIIVKTPRELLLDYIKQLESRQVKYGFEVGN